MSTKPIICGLNTSCTVTCGTMYCTSLSLRPLSVSPTSGSSCNSTVLVNQIFITLPTSYTQIGFLFKAKHTGIISSGGRLFGTIPAAITSIAYLIPTIGVWMRVFEGTGTNFTSIEGTGSNFSSTQVVLWVVDSSILPESSQ